MEPIMSAGIGNKGFYRPDGAMFYPEQPQLYSLAGTTGYNQKNKAKARQLLKEAGYTGQPVRWITTKEYEWMYNTALMSSQQMETWASRWISGPRLGDTRWRRGKQLFDIFPRLHARTRPAIATPFRCGWRLSVPRERTAPAEMARETDPKRRAHRRSGALLRGRRAHQVRDYFDLWVTRKGPRLPAGPLPVLLERLDHK
jgi:hypothetical protein